MLFSAVRAPVMKITHAHSGDRQSAKTRDSHRREHMAPGAMFDLTETTAGGEHECHD